MTLTLSLLLPFVCAVICAFCKPRLSLQLALAVLTLLLCWSTIALFAGFPLVGERLGVFSIDALAAPLLPMFFLLHLLALLGTARTVITPGYCARCLFGACFTALALCCQDNELLLFLLLPGTALPLWELLERERNIRSYLIYMSLFVALLLSVLISGVENMNTTGATLLLLAMLIRGGVFPGHSWLPALFSGASYGTAMLFVLPMMEVLVIIRILLNTAPVWLLEVAGMLCLVSAIYGAGLALVQRSVSRFFAYLCMSQTSQVMLAVLLHNPNGITSALCLWMSATLALTGLAFALRALESRFGSMKLDEYHGHYAQVPGLAALFLCTGLASVGFPGTVGFVPMELLFSGSYDSGLGISFTLAIAAMLNGIALLRVYFLLFTGRRQTTSIALTATWRERIGIALITAVVFGGAWLSPDVVESRHRTAEQLLGITSPSEEH